MKTDNVIQKKSYAFSLKIIELYKNMVFKKKEYVLSKQILRCGTSIGANIEEGIGGQSKPDFIAKMSIAYKEARETNYWLRLLKDSEFIESEKFNSLHPDVVEIQSILAKILITAKKNQKKQ